MSDSEKAVEPPASTPTPKPTPRGKGRGKGKKAAPAKKVAKKPAVGRRGRTKQFPDDKAQAAYERQRELKAAYSNLANAIKPALQDLADRNVDRLKSNPSYYKDVPEYQGLHADLDARLDNRLAKLATQHILDMKLSDDLGRQQRELLATQFQNALDDATEDFLDAQLARLERLEELHDLNLPIDLVDNDWHYKTISDHDASDFGPYLEFNDRGDYIPYPHMFPGTAGNAWWLEFIAGCKAQQAIYRAKPAPYQPKRKAKDQPDGQPSAKKAANGAVSSAAEQAGGASAEPAAEIDIAPAQHTKGLLSAQLMEPADTPMNESGESTPTPDETLQPTATGDYIPLEQMMPPLPVSATDADLYGARLVNGRGTKDKGPNNRIIIPASMQFDDLDIGYRDSTNDPSRRATLQKRGKFLNGPNTATFHYDPMLCGADSRYNEEGDLSEELVEKHRVHPKYGMFLQDSVNEAEPHEPHVSGFKPTIFLTPSGQTIQTSRSVGPAKVTKRLLELPIQRSVGSALSAFCATEGIDEEDIEPPEIKDLREISNAMAAAGHESRLLQSAEEALEEELAAAAAAALPSNDSSLNAQGLDAMLQACFAVDAQERATAPPPTPMKPASRTYDAIRDVFGEAEPGPPAPHAEINTVALSALADACAVRPRHNVQSSNDRLPMSRPLINDARMTDAPPVMESAMRATVDGDDGGWIRPRLSPTFAESRNHQLRPVETSSLRSIVPDQRPVQAPLYSYNSESHPSQNHYSTRDPAPAPHDFIHSSYNHNQPAYMSQVAMHEAPAPPTQHYPARMPFTIPPPQERASPSLPPLRPNRSGPTRPFHSTAMMTMQPLLPQPGRRQHTFQSYQPTQGYGSPPSSYPVPLAPARSPPTLQFIQQQVGMGSNTPTSGRPRTGSAPSTPSQGGGGGGAGAGAGGNNRYPKLAPAPVPAHRIGWPQGPELRTVQYDYKENIKDYSAVEPPPLRGPVHIRGWSVNNNKIPRGMGNRPSEAPAGEQERRDSN